MSFLSLSALCFCFGICIAKFWRINFLFLYAFAWVILILGFIFTPLHPENPPFKTGVTGFIKRNSHSWFILILLICLGGLCLSNTYILSPSHIYNFAFYKSEPVIVKGMIVNFPEIKTNFSEFVLNVRELIYEDKAYCVSGKVLVRVLKKEKFSYGDRLLLKGKLYRPFSFSKEFNYRDYLRRQGIRCILSVKRNSTIKHLSKNAGNPLMSFSYMVRNKMKAVIEKNLSSFSAGIFNAIVLGERQNMPSYANDALLKSGTVHIIAISGFNIGIVVFMTLLILKIMRMPKRLRYILTILFLIVYCILTGANAPVVRATVMAVVLLFSYFLKKEVNIYNSLSIAALIILAVNPWQFFEVSFQLSFLSVIFIVWLAPKIKSLFPEKICKIALMRFLILNFSVSVAAWLGLLPLIAYYFKIITPVTILANMIIVPYAALITVSGFALAIIGILIPFFAPLFSASCEFFILMLFRINSLLISVPGAYIKLPSLPLVYVLLYYALIIVIFAFFDIKEMRKIK